MGHQQARPLPPTSCPASSSGSGLLIPSLEFSTYLEDRLAITDSLPASSMWLKCELCKHFVGYSHWNLRVSKIGDINDWVSRILQTWGSTALSNARENICHNLRLLHSCLRFLKSGCHAQCVLSVLAAHAFLCKHRLWGVGTICWVPGSLCPLAALLSRAE